jgi:hypothetical protein
MTVNYSSMTVNNGGILTLISRVKITIVIYYGIFITLAQLGPGKMVLRYSAE